jgi:hypothetical protein
MSAFRVFATFKPAVEPWKVRNVEDPGDVVDVDGPTVGDAIGQIARTRTTHVREIVLRRVGGERFRDEALWLDRGLTLEFIDSDQAGERAAQDYMRFRAYITDCDLVGWLGALKEKGFDRQALLAEARRRYPGFPLN